MCVWGDEIVLYVPIPPRLAHDGTFHWDYKGVDRCIAPIVQALNDAGIYTANSCCGHGKEDGTIHLHDGRVLVIRTAELNEGDRVQVIAPGKFEGYVGTISRITQNNYWVVFDDHPWQQLAVDWSFTRRELERR